MKKYAVFALALVLALALTACGSQPAESDNSQTNSTPDKTVSQVESAPKSISTKSPAKATSAKSENPVPTSEPESEPAESKIDSVPKTELESNAESVPEKEAASETTANEIEEVIPAEPSPAPTPAEPVPVEPAPAPEPVPVPQPEPAPAPTEQTSQNPEYVMPEEFDRLPTFEEMEPGQQGDNPMWGQPGNTDGIYGEHNDTIIFAQNGNQ